MSKKNFNKSNGNVGSEDVNNQSREEALLLLDKGETFGDSIIGMLAMFACDHKGMGAAAIGLAKALAALKDAARHYHVDIDSIFDYELAYFQNLYEETPDLEEK